MSIIKYRKVWYVVSGTLLLSSIAALAILGLPLGIDFRGGSLLEAEFSGDTPPIQDIESNIQALALGEVLLQKTGSRSIL